MEYQEFRAMNTTIVLGAEGIPDKLTPGFLEAKAFIEESERRFTRFSEDSELSRMNRNGGRWFQASPSLYSLLKSAQAYYYQTEGLFDPSILPALKQIGYERSMDEIRGQSVQIAESSDKYVVKGDFGQVKFEDDRSAVCLPMGMEIDLGGIAKGWIAEKAARILARYSSACAVSAGGDIFLIGVPQDQEKWEVALEDPLDADQNLATLSLGPGAVATSSIAKRQWMAGGKHQHHIIDPRRGEPANTDWISVTVISALATTAEVYAKSLLIAGPQGASELISKKQDIAFIAIDQDRNFWGSPESMEYFYAYDPIQ